jgi:hypothetical protein
MGSELYGKMCKLKLRSENSAQPPRHVIAYLEALPAETEAGAPGKEWR